jgi:hypothetical protein
MNWRKRILGSFIVASVLPACLLLGGCGRLKMAFFTLFNDPHSNNLHYVHCGDATIAVNSSNGTDNQDEIIFMCKGDKITWVGSNVTGQFTIDFQDDSPLDTTGTKFNSQNNIIGPFPAKALEAHKRAKAYKYTLSFSGGTVSFDPHVIIM